VSDLTGQLDIHLQSAGDAPGAAIRSSRPLTAARVFAGKPLGTVAGQLPRLFSVCGMAQAMASALACEAALGCSPARSAALARGLLLRAETVKEHLWRLLLDWPNALARLDEGHVTGQLTAATRVREAAVATAMRAFLQLRGALTSRADPFLPGAAGVDLPRDALERACASLVSTATEQIFRIAPADWLAELGSTADLDRWAAQADTTAAVLVRALVQSGLAALGRCDIATLPSGPGRGPAPGLLEVIAAALASGAADDFIASPLWHGQPAETTPFSRELHRGGLVAAVTAAHGNGLLARLVALLAELARDCALLASAPLGVPFPGPAVAALALAPGAATSVGLGAAPAARGLLVHRLELMRDDTPATTRVLGYRILAPTEWNFHPAGVVATALADIAAAEGLSTAEREARSRMVITAVDPCVDCRLSVS